MCLWRQKYNLSDHCERAGCDTHPTHPHAAKEPMVGSVAIFTATSQRIEIKQKLLRKVCQT